MIQYLNYFNFNARNLLILIAIMVIPSLASAFGPQSSTKAQEWGFDFVEEFDGLADWNQSAIGRVGNQYDADNLARMPKLATGGTSAWDYFSLWGDGVTPAHSWIGGTESGTRQVWRGTKSATIDLGTTANGPSRLGLFLGDTGYQDISIFYMTYITKNQWPTSIDGAGGVGTYTEGQPYIWVSSWKFNTLNMDCNSSHCPTHNTYGTDHLLTLLKHDNYDGGLVHIANPGSGTPERANDGPTMNALVNGGWWGVEYRVTNNPERTAYTVQIWAYAPDGTQYKMMNGETFAIEAAAQGGSWDQFFFGGNNSSQWIWGPTMQSHYYVDDLIIDAGSKGQIGPRYFQRIGGLKAPPSHPVGIGGEVRAQ